MASRRNKQPIIFQGGAQLVVLSQDTAGVRDYLELMLCGRRLGDKVTVSVYPHGGNSRTMLQDAKLALRGKHKTIRHADYVFLVFDRDTDYHFLNVLRDVREVSCMEAFVSIPCFEYFYVLHYHPMRPPLPDFGSVENVLRKCDGFKKYDKRSIQNLELLLTERINTAKTNAELIRRLGIDDGSRHPWTEIDLLINAVELAKEAGVAGLKATYDERLLLRYPPARI